MITGKLKLNLEDMKNLANVLNQTTGRIPKEIEDIYKQVDQHLYLEFRKNGSLRVSTIIKPE